MTTIRQLRTIVVLTSLLSCNSPSNPTVKTSLHQDTIASIAQNFELIETPQSFVKNYGAQDNNRLFVFVGEKIWVEPLPYEQGSRDKGFKAKYAILKKVYGDFPADTIEFVAYDHYGSPPFSKFKNVLLYVSADSGLYYHQKYMYNDVYKTTDGRWAGVYAESDYEHEYNKYTKIRPVKIDFVQTVYCPTKMIDEKGRTLIRTLPKPYFKTDGDSANAIYGNYVEDLHLLKRDGYLRAR